MKIAFCNNTNNNNNNNDDDDDDNNNKNNNNKKKKKKKNWTLFKLIMTFKRAFQSLLLNTSFVCILG